MLEDRFAPPRPVFRPAASWTVPQIKPAFTVRVVPVSRYDAHVRAREAVLALRAEDDATAHIAAYEAFRASMQEAFRVAVTLSKSEIAAKTETRGETYKATRTVKGAYKPCSAQQTKVYFSRG